MNTAGFYKLQDEDLFYAPNFVINKSYELYKEDLDSYTLPVDGWNWFNSYTEACYFLGIQDPNKYLYIFPSVEEN